MLLEPRTFHVVPLVLMALVAFSLVVSWAQGPVVPANEARAAHVEGLDTFTKLVQSHSGTLNEGSIAGALPDIAPPNGPSVLQWYSDTVRNRQDDYSTLFHVPLRPEKDDDTVPNPTYDTTKPRPSWTRDPLWHTRVLHDLGLSPPERFALDDGKE